MPRVIRFGTSTGRWVLTAAVLGSGVVFLDGTVVNVALPAIGRDLHTDVAGLQWTIDAYLVTLTALLLFGGALGDHLGRRRVFTWGLVAFTVASVACAAAPTVTVLAIARAVQGAGGAFLVPGSLAILSATFEGEDRGRAIGAWSGLAGVASAIGPFLGGWLIDTASWRYVFLINVPLAAATLAITLRHVPESRAASPEPLDPVGAVLVSVGLAATCWALIESPHGFGAREAVAATVGGATLVAFLVYEARHPHPMLPLGLFRSRQFSGANATTIAVYGAFGAATFLVVIELQIALGYSALAAGASFLPITIAMLALSARMGALAQRIGARGPMTIGPFVIGAGMLLFTRVEPGAHYFTIVFPGVVLVGLGLATTVAPLTATVMGSVDADELGVASGINNSAARLASLLAVAVLPAVVGLDTTLAPAAFSDRVATAMYVCAALCVLGGVIAFATVRTQAKVLTVIHGSAQQPCDDPCVALPAAGE